MKLKYELMAFSDFDSEIDDSSWFRAKRSNGQSSQSNLQSKSQASIERPSFVNQNDFTNADDDPFDETNDQQKDKSVINLKIPQDDHLKDGVSPRISQKPMAHFTTNSNQVFPSAIQKVKDKWNEDTNSFTAGYNKRKRVIKKKQQYNKFDLQ